MVPKKGITATSTTYPEWNPLLKVQELKARMHGCTIFLKLDSNLLVAVDIPKNVILTLFGIFQYLFMQ